MLDGDVVLAQHRPRGPFRLVQGDQLAGGVQVSLDVLLTLAGFQGELVVLPGRGLGDAEPGGYLGVGKLLGAEGENLGAPLGDVGAALEAGHP